MKKFFLLLALSPLCLFAEEEGGRDPSSFWQTLIMIGIAIVFFYFILWRPESKRRKALEAKRSAMKKGDKVTAMGIIGIIDKIEEKTVVLKNIDGSKIEILKAAVTEVHAPASESES